MSRDEAAWAEIRCAYEGDDETVSALAACLQISEGAIYRRARRDGWVRRSKNRRNLKKAGGKAKACLTKTTAVRAKEAARGDATSGAALIARLYNAMDAKLKRLEARMEAGEELTAAESERETRELGSMIRSFEKVTAFAATLEERVKPKTRRPTTAPGDAERMREEIAQRLERLCADRETAKQSGQPE